MSFYEFDCGDRLYFKSSLFNDDKVVHTFTSAIGGVSHGKIKGMNLGFRVDDDEKSVKENYKLFSNDIGIDLNRTVLAKQTHTDNIRTVTEADCGKGIVRTSDIEDTDGLITDVPGIALVVFSADCVPILFYDPKNSVVAAVHSGWRGSVKKIGGRCIDIMTERFGSNPKDICVSVGPSIGPCCFEFGNDAPNYFDDEYLTAVDNGKYLVNLPQLICDTLTDKGVLIKNIDISGICTVCNCDKFYSYRKHKSNTGRQAAVIMIKE